MQGVLHLSSGHECLDAWYTQVLSAHAQQRTDGQASLTEAALASMQDSRLRYMSILMHAVLITRVHKITRAHKTQHTVSATARVLSKKCAGILAHVRAPVGVADPCQASKRLLNDFLNLRCAPVQIHRCRSYAPSGGAAHSATIPRTSPSTYAASDSASCTASAITTSTQPTTETHSPCTTAAKQQACSGALSSGGPSVYAASTAQQAERPSAGSEMRDGMPGAGMAVVCDLTQEGLESGHMVLIMAAVLVSSTLTLSSIL